MSITSEAASRQISIELSEAKFYFSYHEGFPGNRLPSPPGAAPRESGNVSPVIFDRDYISITQKGYEKICVARLAKGDFTLDSLGFEQPLMLTSDAVLVALIRCCSQPQCEITSSKGENGIPEAHAIPLGILAGQMYFIRLELSNDPKDWKVRGAVQADTLAELKTRLEQVCSGYILTTVTEAENTERSI